ncbi:hypothetical protein [Chryseobacterium foetidum]|uniref:hypothetical protein n=1 Tax=Chryseobacterium foetidum TaxID=2951057 RepID=UPI0021C92B52|nr:hypothetical protein [Chryseobacterium foetidum]
MESVLDIRKRIHEYIDIADERILRIFSGIIDAKEKENDDPSILDYVDQQIDEERQKQLNGESDSQSWEEVKERLMQKFNQ